MLKNPSYKKFTSFMKEYPNIYLFLTDFGHTTNPLLDLQNIRWYLAPNSSNFNNIYKNNINTQ